MKAASFVIIAIAVVVLRIALDLARYPHSGAVYVFTLYTAVLPALLWYWGNTGAAPVFTVKDSRFLLVAAFGLLAAALSFSYGPGHTISDESAYQFQARIFASGRWKADAMPGATSNPANTPSEIYFEQQIDSTRGFFSKYTPAWPLALAVGYLAHCPWLVNPILGVILLLLLNQLARPWGLGTQSLSLMMSGTSAYMLLNSVGFMSHAFAAAVAAAGFAALFHAVRVERLGGIFLGFFFVAIGTEIRPYTGAIVALLCAAYTASALWRKPHLFRLALAVIVSAGLVSVTLFCVINFVYTGNALVTPYAYSRGLTQVDNMTLNPARIFHNLIAIWRPAATDTLWSTFPFVILAAGYAIRYERQFRRELVCLALVFPLLIVAYLLQTEPSASIDGERYYYEGYGLSCIVGARGLLLLISRWRVGARAATLGLAVLFVIQLVFVVVAIGDVQRSLEPWRLVSQASASRAPALVFLSSAPEFASKHANWNEADWKAEQILFLNDPGIARRDEVACRFERLRYRVVGYDAASRRASSQDYTAICVK